MCCSVKIYMDWLSMSNYCSCSMRGVAYYCVCDVCVVSSLFLFKKRKERGNGFSFERRVDGCVVLYS